MFEYTLKHLHSRTPIRLPVHTKVCIYCIISDCLLCIAEKLRCPFSTDLEGNPVIGPRSQAVFIQVPELVEYLGEVLIGLLTVK